MIDNNKTTKKYIKHIYNKKRKNRNKSYKLILITVIPALLFIIIIYIIYKGLNNSFKLNIFDKIRGLNRFLKLSSINQKKNNNTFIQGLSQFKSYSEYYEDLILYIILSDIKKGFYIDIGAYDPNKVSVTKAFYLRGWRGINIEPQPGKIELFKKDRPKDINLAITIGQNEGNVTFYINDQCSSIHQKYANRNKTINIRMDNMSNICKNYVPKGKEIDFCKIDVEGGERDVLLGYDFVNYKPKVFCIESTIPRTIKSNYQLWEDIIINNDFTFVFTKGVNRYYVNKKFPKLLENSKNINKYLKVTKNRRIWF